MYPFIPYKRLRIETKLSPAQAAETLRKSVKPRSWFRFFSSRREVFEGVVHDDRFNINRAIRYRNSFLPILHGRFVANGRETIVDVHMVLHPLVIGFLVLWCGFGLVSLLGSVLEIVRGQAHDGQIWFSVFGLSFLYLLVFVGFGIEAQKATRILNTIFSGEHPHG